MGLSFLQTDENETTQNKMLKSVLAKRKERGKSKEYQYNNEYLELYPKAIYGVPMGKAGFKSRNNRKTGHAKGGYHLKAYPLQLAR